MGPETLPPATPQELLQQWAAVVTVLCGAIVGVSTVMSLIYRWIVLKGVRSIVQQENRVLRDELVVAGSTIKEVEKLVRHHLDVPETAKLSIEDSYRPMWLRLENTAEQVREIDKRLEIIEEFTEQSKEWWHAGNKDGPEHVESHHG